MELKPRRDAAVEADLQGRQSDAAAPPRSSATRPADPGVRHDQLVSKETQQS
jgi:hypothetical protein